MDLGSDQSERRYRRFGTITNVPNDPRAKLMFYLHCICIVLDLDQPYMYRFSDYYNFELSVEEEFQLCNLCKKYSPYNLGGKCIFQDEEKCADSNNVFYEISEVEKKFAIRGNVIIGNQKWHVKKIMFYRNFFIRNKYFEPLSVLEDHLDKVQQSRARRAFEYNRPSRRRTPSIDISPPRTPSPTLTDDEPPARKERRHAIAYNKQSNQRRTRPTHTHNQSKNSDAEKRAARFAIAINHPSQQRIGGPTLTHNQPSKQRTPRHAHDRPSDKRTQNHVTTDKQQSDHRTIKLTNNQVLTPYHPQTSIKRPTYEFSDIKKILATILTALTIEHQIEHRRILSKLKVGSGAR